MERVSGEQLDRLRPVLHGTFLQNKDSILQHGLLPQSHFRTNGRCSVHFLSLGIKLREGASRPRLSDLRYDSSLFVELDIDQWVADGRALYLAPNGVVCVFEPIPVTYFLTMVQGRCNEPLYDEININQMLIIYNNTGLNPLPAYRRRVKWDVSAPRSPMARASGPPSSAQPPESADSASAEAEEVEVSEEDRGVEVPVEEMPQVTPDGIPLADIETFGNWTNNFIDTMKRYQREVIDKGDENRGFGWDYWNLLGDKSWQYPLSLLNVYYVDQLSEWDEFNDCVPAMILYDQLSPFLQQALSYKLDVPDATAWHRRIESGCGLRLWYLIVRIAKMMVTNDFLIRRQHSMRCAQTVPT